MITTWENLIRDLILKEPTLNDSWNMYYKVPDFIKIENIEDPFKLCFYTNRNGKIKMLERQYVNRESINEGLINLEKSGLAEVSLIGLPKHGSNANYKHCLTYMVIDKENKSVVVNFRNSDFIKKFPIDLYLIKEILREMGILDYDIYCNFEKITLRSSYLYIYLNQIYNTQGIEKVYEYMDSNYPIVKKFIEYYKINLKKEIKYKSLERSRRYMMESEVYPFIEKYFQEEKDEKVL